MGLLTLHWSDIFSQQWRHTNEVGDNLIIIKGLIIKPRISNVINKLGKLVTRVHNSPQGCALIARKSSLTRISFEIRLNELFRAISLPLIKSI